MYTIYLFDTLEWILAVCWNPAPLMNSICRIRYNRILNLHYHSFSSQWKSLISAERMAVAAVSVALPGHPIPSIKKRKTEKRTTKRPKCSFVSMFKRLFTLRVGEDRLFSVVKHRYLSIMSFGYCTIEG